MVSLSQEEREKIKKHVILSVRDLRQGIFDDEMSESIIDEPWKDAVCSRVDLIDERTIIKAYAVGILNSLICDETHRQPPGFDNVMDECSADVDLLRFNAQEDGFIRISINELVDRHMRTWVKNSSKIQAWVSEQIILPKAILMNATNHLVVEQRLFEYRYRQFVEHYKKEIKDAHPPKKKTSNKLPSGMHPAIS